MYFLQKSKKPLHTYIYIYTHIVYNTNHSKYTYTNIHKPLFWTFLSLVSVLGRDWASPTALYSALTALGRTCISREIITGNNCQPYPQNIHSKPPVYKSAA